MSDKYDIQIMLDQIAKRLDSHGMDIRDMKNKLDSKIDLVLTKLDDCKTRDYREHCALSNRLTAIESEKGLIGKTLTVLAGLVAGVGGGWLQKHL